MKKRPVILGIARGCPLWQSKQNQSKLLKSVEN